ncbi:MAG: DUF1957 domain-containing protein [Clostridiales bacterium]|nr:DUF1957 domain-containing protein [Clostridiales bacterium]MCF8021660.1 DUF1957 domain-containing protein [Clostridiales bacterium]
MAKGYLALVLHAHLPYIRHPEDENFLEEKWLYEAITETYIPLIESFNRLVQEGIPFRITVSLSPPLLSMLTDRLLQERYTKHLDKLIELSEKEVELNRNTPFYETAVMYRNQFYRTRYIFCEQYGCNLVQAFRTLEEQGRLELITCAGTHGFLPLMKVNPSAVRAQVGMAVEIHRQYFNKSPRGIWLPECAYTQGIDNILKEFNLRFFFTDSHGVLFASHRPRFGLFAPIYCPNTGLAAFARDIESSKQVWSADEGYPGDSNYREFFRDIGFERELDYIKPYIHPDGIRVHTGIKYFRITGRTQDKEPYNPHSAHQKAIEHAGNFLFNREKQVEFLSSIMERPPIIIAPYDAELYGHWWFEGPVFLEHLIRKMHYNQDTVKLITPGDYLQMFPCNQVATPCDSTWGNKGYNEVWLCGANDWIYRHLHIAADRMEELSNKYPNADGILERALKQAARELLLAQSSDWAFIMKTGTMVNYAVNRTKRHLLNFLGLYKQINENRLEETWISELENKNNIFPNINYHLYRSHYNVSA